MQGAVQFYIEAVESSLPNIIDSLLINLDNLQLQLGADFTEEMTFTGYHNISHMTMSFKVECASDYYDPNCTTFCVDNSGSSSCSAINRQQTNASSCTRPDTLLLALSGVLSGVGLLAMLVIAVVMIVVWAIKKKSQQTGMYKAD